MRKAITLLFVSLTWAFQCHAAVFQTVALPGEAGNTVELAIWYPSATPVAARDMGVFTQEVASNGPIRGVDLPLVVISHGTGGNALIHYDTALVLANAGFVVVAITHPGDNHRDQSRSVDVLARPKHVTAALDYMLGQWDKRAALAPARIGIIGHSAGGFTALVSIGGKPDLKLVAGHCKTHVGDFACRLVAHQKDQLPHISGNVPKALHNTRIKAAVIAAPALGFTFDAASLRDVKLPIQLWRAENDVLLPHPFYAEAVRNALPVQPEYHVVSGAGHFDFLAPCSEKFARVAPPICTSQPGFDRASFHQRFNARVVAFFEKALAF